MGPWQATRAEWTAVAALAMLMVLAPVSGFGAPSPVRSLDGRVAERVMTLTRKTEWKLVGSIPLQFRTFHPQGMVKIGADFYLSSVELPASPAPAGAAGRGHLFKFDADGKLSADRLLGEGAIYHPGGIDEDGRTLWVPVSEYRPDSRAIIYRVDPATMTASEAFRVSDHIGAVAFDRSRRELRGLSWGSRRYYRWRIGAGPGAKPALAAVPPTPNRSHYIDYQDCHGVGAGRMLCSGVADYPAGPSGERFQLGGLELIDLGDDRPVWQAPLPMRSAAGRPMTQNPFFVEATQTGLRAYFVPDDDASILYVYEVTTGAP